MDHQRTLAWRSLLLDILGQRQKVNTVSYVRKTKQSEHYRRRAQQFDLAADATTTKPNASFGASGFVLGAAGRKRRSMR